MAQITNLNNNLLGDNNTVSLGLIQLAINVATVSENNNQVAITLLRVNGSDGQASVQYSTTDGTATEGLDYIKQAGTLTFAAGETSKTVTIPILNDSIVEANETFSFLIGEPVGAELGVPRTALITIEDNDTSIKPIVKFSQANYTVSENGTQATITIVREGGDFNSTASVKFATVDDYAKSNNGQYADYNSVSRTLTFAPGETSKTVTVPIINDTLSENNESLKLVLSNPVNIDLGVQNTATLTITNDDPLPSGFKLETLITGLNYPAGFDWISKDKILIAEVPGKVSVFDQAKGQLLDTPFIDLTSSVNALAQRGLLSIAVHPDFPNNPYVYLGYSYDSPQDLAELGPDNRGPRDTRLVRITADPSTNYTTAIPGSEVVLMTIPGSRSFHASAGLRFGTDGSLFYAHGDGNVVGNVLSQPLNFTRLDYPFGKLYRIDPITGQGYADNPFYTGNVNDIASKVYSYGFRNPFRIAINPKNNEPYIGDVGLSTWEEINTGRGANFGWPFFEGGNGETLETAEYANDPRYQPFYNTNPNVTAPIYARNHSEFTSITLGDFYSADVYPEIFHDSLFFTDFGKSKNLEALIFDENGNIETSVVLDKPQNIGITQLLVGLDGYLYGTSLTFTRGTALVRWTYDAPQEPDPILLKGTAGRDTLTGTNQAENIQGLQDRDILIGGGGKDRFTYTSVQDGGDIIKDFTVGQDKIDVSQLLDSVGYTGSNPISDRWLQFSSRDNNSIISFDPDGSGAARSRSFIVVEGVSLADLNNTSNFIF